ncbi:phytoene desaturase family protein [Hyphococcus sp.]|uniref:phytoene desaturase family protein n=1 Tax=Hyphococcus sp. TaxID=2038636 RepID=UPI0035C78269
MTNPLDQNGENKGGNRIEGGIDAVVIGAGADGLAASAYLGKAGLRTVLVGAGPELGGRIAAREIAPGVTGIDGEHLITVLDPDVISELDLYRYGVEFAARRLDTTYFFENGGVLRFDGDLTQAALLNLDDDSDREALEAFMGDVLETAAFLRPAFHGGGYKGPGGDKQRALEKAVGQAPPEMAARIQRYLYATAEDILRARFEDSQLRTLLLAETSFRSAAAPHEPFSFMSLLRRYAGEAAGLQGAAAYAKGGAVSIIDALRRAAQGAKVDMRAAAPVKSILIEGDRVAGVVMDDGGQLRAPIVLAAIDARKVFQDMIGPGVIDIGLQRILTARRPEIASARMQIILKGVAQDEATRKNMMRRLVYAPSPEALSKAFMDARAGRVPERVIVEAVFPTALDEGAALDKRQVMSVMAHPLPFDEAPDADRREAIRSAILDSIEMFAAGFSGRIEVEDLRLTNDDAAAADAHMAAYAAKPDVLQQWALAAAVTGGPRISGFYFCGPEAQIGAGLSCAAGRAAAKAALRAYKKGAA